MLAKGNDGTYFFDTNTKLTPSICQKMKASNYTGAIRYIGWGAYANDPGDLTKDEMNAILDSGLGLMVVQHVRGTKGGWVPTVDMGKADGQTAIAQLDKIGVPTHICVWCDLEGIKPGTSHQDIIDYCNAWYDAVVTYYEPGIYIGYNSYLSGSELYNTLKFTHYWRSLSSVPDVSVRGYQMVQQGVSGPINGIEIDKNTLHTDLKGDSVVYCIKDIITPPTPQPTPTPQPQAKKYQVTIILDDQIRANLIAQLFNGTISEI